MNRRGTRASRRVTVLTAALLGAAVGAGTIAGCANDEPEPQAQEKPDKEQEPAPDPEPTQEPTPEGPELPDKLDGPHVRTVLKYYDEYNKAMKSGNAEGYLRLATNDCWSCANSAKVLEETFENGGRYEGEFKPLLDEDKNLARLGDDTANVTLRFDRSEVLIYRSEDADPKAPDEPLVDTHVNLIREGNKWKIKEITSVPVGQ